MSAVTLEQITALAKRRGFIFPSSEIYGGLANSYDYGPMGVELLRAIKDAWWQHFVSSRPDVVGLDTSILMSPKVWEASGHTDSFSDVLVDCKKCKLRTRADHLIENHTGDNVEGLSAEELSERIAKETIPCPECGAFDWTPARSFNLLFETAIGILPEKKSQTFLRGEIAQGMFVNFKNVTDSARLVNLDLEAGLPFGIAQSGKAFRNEITKGSLTFRTLEFNLAEIEYFFDPEATDWKKLFQSWQEEMMHFATNILGLPEDSLQWREHTDEERAHYSQHTEDVDFMFPFGSKEMFGLAYRTDFDLKNHAEKSGAKLEFLDPKTNKKVLPHTIEPTFGIDRAMLAVLSAAYTEEDSRTVLKLKPSLAPYQVAVFPLVSNKPDVLEKARDIFKELGVEFRVAWDARGNIGKRYFAQDEIGTPLCVTIDYGTLDDNDVTVRHRDTMKQDRVPLTDLASFIRKQLT